jgi:hypothetical protein
MAVQIASSQTTLRDLHRMKENRFQSGIATEVSLSAAMETKEYENRHIIPQDGETSTTKYSIARPSLSTPHLIPSFTAKNLVRFSIRINSDTQYYSKERTFNLILFPVKCIQGSCFCDLRSLFNCMRNPPYEGMNNFRTDILMPREI